ncbi:GATOR complex protein WDR59-like isoform X1 [Macrosteles quadrilineatus]|uniref:GATOR complex protein WDR59-like isoform X1 n=1 Tax=Macrosteles quadrilineatus TaxID=74068 RepID=UPI0023E2CB3A|nr:GATOR complex protein WDR59-like isoform X1 [Macrosteles quadrilineatus]
MATRWSSEFIIAEHRDLQASAMAVDSTGSFVLLAGRRFLGLKKLDDSSDVLRKFPRQSKYEVGTAEWNPNHQEKELCAISSNQRVEVYKLGGTDLTQLHTLNNHTRVVTDLDWHRSSPELLASCSIDTYTHVWDLRDPRRPAVSLSSVAGANQVRWNRLSRYLLATAHNGDIRLWDQRKGTAPVQYITAHLANIHSLDWSQTHENQLATASQDCTVKFFDTTNPRRAENIITASAPVWRARYTPFGDGLLMVVVPPMRRGENSLLLWNLSNLTAPVHTFVGHTDTVLECEWRRHKDESSDYQLITWSKDQTLRIWQIEPFLQKLCGHDPDGDTATNVDILTTTSALESEGESEVMLDTASSTLSNSSSSQDLQTTPASQPKTLQQEFSLVNVNSRNITFDKMDVVRRTCSAKISVGSHIVYLLITFPPNYPYGSAPAFQFASGSNVDIVVKTKLLKVMKHTAQQRVHRNRSCLDPCLRQAVATLEQISANEEVDKNRLQISPVSLVDHSSIFTGYQDASIPYPRTSGAKFCNVGLLVTFCKSGSVRRLAGRTEAVTPRSLSALPEPVLSVSSSYYFHDRPSQVRPRVGGNLSRRPQLRSNKALVIVYDASQLFFVQRNLAENYIFDWANVPGMCHHNAMVAASVGRRDLVQAWSLAALATTDPSNDRDDDFPWHAHPFSRNMLQSIIWHFAKQYDIQMAAMLSCALSSRLEGQAGYKNKHLNKATNNTRVANGKWWIKPGGSPYHTIHQVDTSVQGWNFSVLKQNRSNSWSESLDDCRLSNIVEHFSVHTEIDRSLEVDEANTHLYDEYKQAYAEILYRWRLLDARAQVLKFMSAMPEPHRGIEPKVDCQHCRKSGLEANCTNCKKPALQCVICHLSVRGSMSSCLVCGHGGHLRHMQEWFKTESVCPSGCGCHCIIESASVVEP